MIYFKLLIGGRRPLRQPHTLSSLEAVLAWVDGMDRVVMHLVEATGQAAAWQQWYGLPVFCFDGPLGTAKAAVQLLDPTLRVVACAQPKRLDETVEEALDRARRGMEQFALRVNETALRLQAYSLRIRHIPAKGGRR